MATTPCTRPETLRSHWWQFCYVRKPLLPGFRKLNHFGPVVGPAYDSTQSDDQNVQKIVALDACHAGV